MSVSVPSKIRSLASDPQNGGLGRFFFKCSNQLKELTSPSSAKQHSIDTNDRKIIVFIVKVLKTLKFSKNISDFYSIMKRIESSIEKRALMFVTREIKIKLLDDTFY